VARARQSERSPTERDSEEIPSIEQIERLADWLDSRFRIPGVPVRFGLDALIGLLPGVGDTATSLAAFYILQAASRHGVPKLTIARMAMNLAVDYLVGSIPFVGDAFDVYWKANRRNVELLRQHARANPVAKRRLRHGDWLFLAGILLLLFILLIGSLTVAWFLIRWISSQFSSG